MDDMDEDVRQLFARALAEQEVEWEWEDEDSFAPCGSLVELHERVTSEDLEALWAEFSDGDEDQRILLVRVCGEARAAWPPVVEAGLLAWLEEPVEPPLLDWLPSSFTYRDPPLPAALRPALRLVTHPNEDLRYLLTGLLTMYVPHPEAVDGLVRLAGDEDGDVHFGAIYELDAHAREGLSDPRVEDLLRQARTDPDERVRAFFAEGRHDT